MIEPLEIRKEIARLEYEESSYSNYMKLATLYAIRDEMNKNEQEQRSGGKAVLDPVSRAAQSPARAAETDFRAAINGKSQEQVLSVIDELVDSLSISQPKLYSAVINKLNRL